MNTKWEQINLIIPDMKMSTKREQTIIIILYASRKWELLIILDIKINTKWQKQRTNLVQMSTKGP